MDLIPKKRFKPTYNKDGQLLTFQNVPCCKVDCRRAEINVFRGKKEKLLVLLPESAYPLLTRKCSPKRHLLAICLAHFKISHRHAIQSGEIEPTAELIVAKNGVIKIRAYALRRDIQETLSALKGPSQETLSALIAAPPGGPPGGGGEQLLVIDQEDAIGVEPSQQQEKSGSFHQNQQVPRASSLSLDDLFQSLKNTSQEEIDNADLSKKLVILLVALIAKTI